MSEKTDSIEIKGEEIQEDLPEKKDVKKKRRKKKDGPIEKRIIKRIVRKVKETEEPNIVKTVPDEIPSKKDVVSTKPVSKKEKKPAKKKRKWPIILLLIILLLAGLLWYAFPYIRIYTGNFLYNHGRYEDAIALVQGMEGNEEAGHIIEDCTYKIAEKAAQHILNNDKELKEYGMKLEKVYDDQNALDYENKNEISSFVAEYKNDRFTYKGSYVASVIKKDDGTWKVTAYSEKEKQIVPVKKPSKVLAGSSIVAEYPEARYKETKQTSESEVIYVFEMLSWEKPLYKTGYEISARCSYDIQSDSWKLNEIQKELKKSEEIPFRTFTTSIFTIKLPESWIITKNEAIETKKVRTTEYTEYKYNYTFYPDLERDTELMNISVSFSLDKKSSSNGAKNTLTGKNVGVGAYSEGNGTYSVSFQPKIRKMNSSFVISGYGIEKEELQKIIDSIVIVDHHYKLTVVPEGVFNIRDDYSSKSGKVVATAKQGDKFTASRAVFNEGYTWYDVAEGKWIADKDGEWLLVE